MCIKSERKLMLLKNRRARRQLENKFDTPPPIVVILLRCFRIEMFTSSLPVSSAVPPHHFLVRFLFLMRNFQSIKIYWYIIMYTYSSPATFRISQLFVGRAVVPRVIVVIMFIRDIFMN